jgi:hypothetical protein
MKKIFVFAALLAAGCAHLPSPRHGLPPCERFGYSLVESTDGQPLAILDVEGMQQLTDLIRGLAEGKCRLPQDGEKPA